MDLRLGLSILGGLVVLATGLTVYDRGRAARRLTGRRRGRSSTEVPVTPVVELTGSEPEPARVMVEDGTGGRVIYGRRWMEARGQQPPSPAAIEKPAQQHRSNSCLPDEIIDFTIRLPGHEPVARDQVLALYKQEESLIERPHRFCGLRFGTTVSVDLEREEPDGQYGDLLLTLQLADYRGPAVESELNRLSQIGLKIADAVHRQPQFSVGFEEALQRAADLDKFCAAFDVIASVSIMPSAESGFAGEEVRSAAFSQGMEFGPRNVFHMRLPGKGERILFTMANLFKPGAFEPDAWEMLRVKGLALFMNVPCVNDPHAVFERMLGVANHLAAHLGGILLDQDHKPLTEHALGVIRAQIGQIVTGMERHNILPGSVRALRLFEP
ncbi:MAG: cell division protein ZipA [Acidiferrobacteraceae bacterium]